MLAILAILLARLRGIGRTKGRALISPLFMGGKAAPYGHQSDTPFSSFVIVIAAIPLIIRAGLEIAAALPAAQALETPMEPLTTYGLIVNPPSCRK